MKEEIQLMGNNDVLLGPFVTNEFGDRYLHEVNRSAFNKVGSDALFRQIYGDRLFQEDSLNIVIGTDSGLLPSYVLKRGVPDGTRFLFIELPAVLDRIKQSPFFHLKNQRMEFTTYRNWKKAAEQLYLTDYIVINKFQLHQSVGAMDANILAFHELYWIVSEELTKLTWETHAALGIQNFVVRQLENLAENRHSSLCLKNTFKGKTAILLGGGPSLDDIIPWLKCNGDRVVVIAVSRICRRLLECGVTPHMVFSVDPQVISFDISKDLFHFWRKTLFVHAYHVSPPLLAQWKGKSVFSGPRFPWETHLNVDTLPSAGPTVTNAALASAVIMGFSQVLLAGVDLCFSREGYSHAKGSNEHKLGPELGEMGLKVLTNGGWMAETRPDYAAAMSILDQQAAQALEKGCKVINIALGAVKVPNISYANPGEISMEPLQKSPEEAIAGVFPSNLREGRITYYHALMDELTSAENAMRKIRKLAREGLRCTDRLAGSRTESADSRYYRRMNKIEKTLNRQFKRFVPLVKQFGIRDFLRIIRPGEEDAYIEDTDRINRLGIYYKTYVDSTKALIGLIENAEQRLQARLEEERKEPDIDLLLRQWKNDCQPGRYLVWKKRNSAAEKQIFLSYGEALKGLENEFQKIMEEKETAHMRLMRKKITLAGVRSRASILFQNQDIDELERLAEGLVHNADPRTEILLNLTRGYLAELRGNRQAALKAYQGLMSEEMNQAVLEDALRRIAFICIGNRNIGNAVAALQCLAQLSASYAPQYAEMLRLTGDEQAAAGVYSDYLQKVPDDLGTMLKLGKLYKDMHANEAARMAFNYVLERDPENGAAKAMLRS
jgi:hypothetical protein